MTTNNQNNGHAAALAATSSKSYQLLIKGNRDWVEKQITADADFFTNLAKGQSPEVLWIGCSDSRVPANEVTGTRPGEVFVHRNIANVVVHSDMNLLSVLDYAVNVLKVKHVIVAGHYGCGGVAAAMSNKQFGLIDNWLRNIKDVYRLHAEELDAIDDQNERVNRLVELNAMEQVYNLCKTTIVQNAWKNGQDLSVHGWVIDLKTGLIKDLQVSSVGADHLGFVYQVNNEPVAAL
ncbi:carbonic anhydrase [Mucilaginibacter yixingensis]|uniref:Carbonic anhydrase 2 n=1 Tax=Mucilaginibacter yixingensis TaxID=1295612 RepID=A0A2T5JFJ9_9SPHI|nr:carbonate dehydratase [Mucilaginibacter yixingensis]PTR01210.1 carbonic anhydrase [Mucilaginibacter yixingensis]